MNKLIHITIILTLLTSGCSSSPATASRCGVDSLKVQNLLKRDRGQLNGAIDDNRDGRIDYYESFAEWDFMQIEMVLQQGTEFQEYKWTNIDTCYAYDIKATDFYEDSTKGALYMTCRNFVATAYNPDGRMIGSEKNTACRNFATHKWEIY